VFFDLPNEYDSNIALYDADDGSSLTYQALREKVAARIPEIGPGRRLVFIAADNNIHTVVDYLSCLKGGHVVHLLDSSTSAKARALIDLYKPNIVIDEKGVIASNSDQLIPMHVKLALLLSTSGSTGTPKFVKLSYENIDSNALAIDEYLEIGATERAICHLKLHYSFGLSILNSHLHAGAATILTRHNIISEEFWQAVDSFNATSFAGVPHNYETLLHSNFSIKAHPSIRYATQAGGKLVAPLVEKFARDFKAAGARFIVMYGQTEAAPRISYLPSDMAEKFPGTIGRSIPGGELYLVDERKIAITEPGKEGELAYKGPNVMLGYAENPDGLAGDETPEFLLTGDIAYFNAEGLFTITGRTKRFVKPFGLRVNLDDVQGLVKEKYPTSAVSGHDSLIVVAVSDTNDRTFDALKEQLSKTYKLPLALFTIRHYDALPLLPSGKYDYKKILDNEVSDVTKPGLVKRVIDKIMDILEIRQTQYGSILEIYKAVLETDAVTEQDSFNDLEMDSLSYVTLSIELEEALGSELPMDWKSVPISQLDEIYSKLLYAGA
jgi:acyl-CoA synthetase (AMP-forming)/AMP-acid ligase II/acyl carrier protein